MIVCGIYQIKNKVDGKFYIGSSIDIFDRWKGSYNAEIQEVIRTFGKENLEYSIIEECEKDLLGEREQYYIETLNPAYNKIQRVYRTIKDKNRFNRVLTRQETIEIRKKIRYTNSPEILIEFHKIRKFTWREIADGLGLNVYYVFRYAKHKIEPTNLDLREKLGLKPTCTGCGRVLRKPQLILSEGDELMYQQIIADTPQGLEKLLLQILSKKIGKDNAIKRSELLPFVQSVPGYSETSDRQVRKTINDLRKQGILICSSASEDGGYYMAASLAEFDEFVQRELGAKIADMSQTLKSMTESAQKQFGDSFQMSLV